MARKYYVYLVDVDDSINRVQLDPYSSFAKADNTVEIIYNQCLEESKKYPRSKVSEKKLVTSKFDEMRGITKYEWIVNYGLVENKYTARIKKSEVQ